MLTVAEEDAAAIRAAFDHGGEFPAAVELRRRFFGNIDNAKARVRSGHRRLEAASGLAL